MTDVDFLTGTVIASVLKSCESTEKMVDDLVPRLGSQVVKVSENSTHLAALGLS